MKGTLIVLGILVFQLVLGILVGKLMRAVGKPYGPQPPAMQPEACNFQPLSGDLSPSVCPVKLAATPV